MGSDSVCGYSVIACVLVYFPLRHKIIYLDCIKKDHDMLRSLFKLKVRPDRFVNTQRRVYIWHGAPSFCSILLRLHDDTDVALRNSGAYRWTLADERTTHVDVWSFPLLS